jgi:endonuclease YncB( thermonuclease family)
MKFLAFLFSLLLGGAVLLLFLQPWEIHWRRAEIETARDLPPAVQSKPPPPVTVSPTPVPQAAQSPEPQSKRTLLAREQAEAEREAALKPSEGPAITPEAPTKRYFKVKIRDAGTLEVDRPGAETIVIRLDGIEAHAADETCTREDGSVWPCGAKAKAALTLFIRSRAVTCTLPQQKERSEFAARCSVRHQDLATWLVRRGLALPKDNSEAQFAAALQAAKSERLGFWEDD